MSAEQIESEPVELVVELSRRHGELIGGDTLRHVLGFQTMAAFKKAVGRGTLSLPTFFLEGRRGRFALTADIAKWMLSARNGPATQGIKPQHSNLPRKDN